MKGIFFFFNKEDFLFCVCTGVLTSHIIIYDTVVNNWEAHIEPVKIANTTLITCPPVYPLLMINLAPYQKARE